MTPQKVILYNLLLDPKTEASERLFAQLKKDYFTNKYDKEIFHAIYSFRHGTNANCLPTLAELQLGNHTTTIDAFYIPDDYVPIDSNIALEAIESTYIQSETLKSIKNLVTELDDLEANEIIPKILTVATGLEDKLNTNNRVTNNKGFRMFINTDLLDESYKPVGICNQWDANAKGLLAGEVLLLGGKRGAGKSVISANICIAQYCMGLIAPYFTIEMNGFETRTRMFSILSGVDQTRLKHQKLEGPELGKALLTRLYSIEDEESVVLPLDLNNVEDIIKFDEAISKNDEKLELIVVDDRDLTLSVIDLTLGQLLNKYQKQVSMGIVDYINVVRSDESNSSVDNLDWKIQMVLSQNIKNLARKHNLPIVSPYQVDSTGEARLAKGLLDSVDFAFTIDKKGNSISLTCAKARGGEEINYTTYMNWKALKIVLDPLEEKEVPEDDNKDTKRKRDKD